MAQAMESAGATVLRHGLPNQQDGSHKGVVFPGDLSKEIPASARTLAQKVLTHAPETSLLVCNAGTCIDTPFPQIPFEDFLHTMHLNVFSPFALVQEFAQHWIREGIAGRVVLTGSINGQLSEPVHVAYDTSKGAVGALMRSLSVSLAPHGIRVNGVAPGLVYTGLTASALDDDRFRRWMELHTPNGSVPGPETCGGATVFLLSDAAEHIAGQMLLVDGGMSVSQQPDPPDNWT